MAGRGFLKSRLAQVAPKEHEEPPKPCGPPNPEEPPKLASPQIPHTSVPRIPTAVPNLHSLVAGNQQVVRGRRVIIIIVFLLV